MLSIYVLAALTAITQSNVIEDGVLDTASKSETAPSHVAGAKRPNPIPKGNPGQWANTSDYPSAALQKQIEGTTGFRVTVGPDGFVTQCQIISSSGSSELDQATCTNVQRRARFDPALDAQGKPMPGTYANRVRWQIPSFAFTELFPRPPVALNYGWTRILPEDFPKAVVDEKRYGNAKIELAILPDGTVQNCKIIESSGHADLDDASCNVGKSRATFKPALDIEGRPTEGRLRTILKWEAKQPPVTALGGINAFDLLPKPGATRMSFVVGKDGVISDCEGEVTGQIKVDPKMFCQMSFKLNAYKDEKGNPVARRVNMSSKIEVEDLPE